MILSMGLFVFVMDEGMNPKELHKHFLENSPFKEDVLLNKKDRLSKGLPPNKFNEQIYDLTIDPVTGEHNYESKLDVQEQIQRDIYSDRYAVPGQSATTPWYEIGPKNAAGRSRAAVWDQSDLGGTRVIAGGVSGGLWKNNDITDVGQVWTRVLGVPGNLAISVIVQDPNNTSVLYAGTGESYTGGDASGNGIYKSIDGGSNWNLVFGRGQSTTVTTTFSGGITRVEGYFAVNDIILYDHDNNAGTDAQVFAAIGTTWHSRSLSTGLDPFTYGLFKSTDAGSTFTQITSVSNGSQVDEINDLEVQAISNRIWLSTTSSNYWSGIEGGRFWYSDDGTSFTQATPTFPAFPTTSATTRHRTEIAPSQTDTDTHYVLIQTSSTSSSTANYPRIPIIYKTTDNFSTFTYVEPPIDADQGIPNYDFTRGQSFYDLEIEVDPTNDDILYVGGIDWFRSQNGGTSWSQITRWSQFNPGLFGKPYSVVHADQHGLYFKPGDPNKAIVVNDGGVAYSSSLSTASDTSTFGDREKELITLQFYTVAQSPPDFAGNDYIVGGTQDNGTWSIIASANNKTNGTEVQGGDGAATVFDQVGGDYYISNYIYNNSVQRAGFTAGGVAQPHVNLSNSLSLPSNEGDFINPAALDSNRDVYFSCAGNGKIRVITGLERDGTIQHFLINFSGTRHVTALEVSRHTTNTTTLFAGLSDGEVLKITNAGANGASTITSVYNQTGSVSDIHIGETEDDIYVTYYNYGINSNIRFTDDGFTTSSNKEGDFPDFPVLSILNNPYVDDEVIIGTELGIWRTANFTNANPTWVPAYNGMSDVPVYDMDFRGVSAMDNRVVAASYGRGVYTGSFTSPNNPPVTTTEIISVLEAGTATTTTNNATSVLANDTDTESDNLTADLVSNPINGAVFALSTTGSFTYTHDGSETTTDSFSYRAFDGISYGNTVTVTINITPVNDCPVVANPIADFTVQEDAANNVFNISNLFSDAEGDVLNYTFTNDNTGLVTVTLNTNTLTLDYIDDQTGVATVTINANDGACSFQEVFVVTVTAFNDSPVTTTEIISVLEAGTATTTTNNATSVLANDTDTESDNLTADLVSNPINGAVFALSTTGSFTYTHDGSETTTDSFSYRAFDGISYGNTVTVTINITPVNDCPVVANPIADFTVQEDAANNVFNISNLFSDAEGDVLNYTFTNDNTGLVTVTLNTNTLTLDYIDDQTGVATVTINANDGACSFQEVFVVTVTAVNDPPVTVTESLLVNEGGTVTITTNSVTSLLANDTDTEGDPITAIVIIGNGPYNGTLSLLSSGTFSYTHGGSETTTDTFQYKTNDGFSDGNTVTVTISINPVNDCPVWNNSAVAAQFNGPTSNEDFSPWFFLANLQSLINDPDNAAHTFTVTHTNPEIVNIYINPANNRLSYSSILNRHGSTTGTITISDGICELYQPISYTVNSVNDCPTLDNPIADVSVAEDDPDFFIPLANVFSDVDTDTLTYSTNIGNPTMIATSITATALVIDFLENQNGSTYISLVVSDGDVSCTVDDLITVSISQTNDAPNGVEDFISVPTGGSVNVLNDGSTNSVLSNDNDPESNPITAVEVLGPINGTLTLLSNGNFTYTHDGSGTTTDTFTYTPRDNFSIGNTTTVTIYINDLPVGVTENIALLEGGTATTTTNAVTSVLANDTDTNGGDAAILTATIGTGPIFGALSLNSNGSFSYTHDGTENFTDSFTYIPYDGKGYGLATSVSINVTPTNDPPVAYPDSITIGLGGTTTLLSNGGNNILSNDTDPDADSLTATLVTGPNFGTLVLNPGGTFSYLQNGVMNGGDSFTYKAKDASLFSNVVTVNIGITCSPCTQSTIVGGSDGVLFSYQGCDCNSYQVYVPKGKTYIFCHLVNTITISQGAYTVIATSVCN